MYLRDDAWDRPHHQPPEMRPPFHLPSVTALLFVAAACHSDPTAPRPPIGIHVVAGGDAVDTVQARLVQALTVEVHDSSGQVASGRVVRFTAAPADDPARQSEATLRFEALTSTSFATTGVVTADSRGQASIIVALGTVAGTAHAVVTVPELGLVDTVNFTVLPGAAAKLVLSPRDTTVAPAATFVLTAKAIDRLNNTVTGTALTFTPGTGIASVSTAGQVTVGPAIARSPILVRLSATVFDSAEVTVLPRLPLVANLTTGGQSVALVNLDGTNSSIVASTSDESLSPSSVHATSNIAYYIGDPASDATVMIVSPGGTSRVLAGPANGFVAAAWPRLSSDGNWVYFTGLRSFSFPVITTLWRIHPDGSNLDSLGAFAASAINTAPAISPDGATAAVDDMSGLMLINVASKAVHVFSTACGDPRFSPDGTRIACVRDGALSVMHSDGTGLVSVPTPFGNLDDLTGADWSPDGLWLLVAQQVSNALLVNVQTGAAIQLTALPASYSQYSFVR